ncbi:heme ABC transporter ATP-binding protein [Paenibacillus sp. UNC499MF]|uniref:heme ABC transporter ATP-binding protein n=1 Tax=Paenibacillus sp. UNC499MF TaxID=1502751 RepID=UPI0008A04807|nr:heme ABC transporter ATP-binding protein [Paenibacillus sp. UNC499MF]SEF89526.1 iron complex transport system ATP-binding protein [Paenibacillus sp. UNC499MF]
MEPIIEVQGAGKSFGGTRVLKDIRFEVKPGEFFGIIGPNGSGKSTLLRLVSGVDPLTEGRILLQGKEVAGYSRKELARWLAVLQQDALPPLGFTVREVVEMGRFPFQNWLGEDREDAAALVDRIMRRLDLEALADRTVENLSGGQKQRVALAKVMAQEPRLLLLDEPTTYLDIGYQMQLMDYVRQWQREEGLTVVAVLHDLNLAALYCERLLVVHEGEGVSIGTPEEIMRSELIRDVYGTEPIVLEHPEHGIPQILLRRGD